jgi:hypothetical protein
VSTSLDVWRDRLALVDPNTAWRRTAAAPRRCSRQEWALVYKERESVLGIEDITDQTDLKFAKKKNLKFVFDSCEPLPRDSSDFP